MKGKAHAIPSNNLCIDGNSHQQVLRAFDIPHSTDLDYIDLCSVLDQQFPAGVVQPVIADEKEEKDY